MRVVIVEAIQLALLISLIPMLAISLGAGVATLLQTVTQVQEQSLIHLVRLVVMGCLLVWGGEYAFGQIEGIFRKVLLLCSSGAGS